MPASITSSSSTSSSVPLPPPKSSLKTRSNSTRISSNFSLNCFRIPSSSSSITFCKVFSDSTRSSYCVFIKVYRSDTSLNSSIALTLTLPSPRMLFLSSPICSFSSLSGLSLLAAVLASLGRSSYSSQRYSASSSRRLSKRSLWLFMRRRSLSRADSLFESSSLFAKKPFNESLI